MSKRVSIAQARTAGHCRASTASSGSHWALPVLNWAIQISVGTAGPQLRAPNLRGHCRASTASSGSQWALPDLNRKLQISVGAAGPQLRGSGSQWVLPDLNHQLQISVGAALNCELRISVPDLNHELWISVGTGILCPPMVQQYFLPRLSDARVE